MRAGDYEQMINYDWSDVSPLSFSKLKKKKKVVVVCFRSYRAVFCLTPNLILLTHLSLKVCLGPPRNIIDMIFVVLLYFYVFH